MPELSVVIAAYNANATLGLQLEALTRQQDAPSFEVVIVDNGSDVSPETVVDAWRSHLEIRLLRAVREQGVAYARNVGLAAARAPRVVFCDADDCAGPGFLRAASSALEHAPFVTGRVQPFSAQTFERGYEHVRDALAVVPNDQAATLVPADPTYPVFMGGASAVMRDDAVALGGFDQNYVPGAEDNDFGLRVLEAGRSLLRCADLTLAERRRATSRGTLRRSFDGGRMHMRLCAGHDLWDVSPHLRAPRWWVDLLRLPLPIMRTFLSRPDAQARLGLAGRCGLRAGQAAGFVTYRVLRRRVETRRGLGIDEGLAQRGRPDDQPSPSEPTAAPPVTAS